MKIGAGVLGLIFGLWAFFVFGFGFGLADGIAKEGGGSIPYYSTLKYYGIPLLAIAGALITFSNGLIGGVMMLLGAAGIYYLGVEWQNAAASNFTLYLGAPIAVSGAVGILGQMMDRK